MGGSEDPRRELVRTAEEWGLSIDLHILEVLERFAVLLLEWNSRTNLTAIVDPGEVWVKHFIDSLSCLRHMAPSGRMVDVGSGAGFPGLVLAMARPEWQFVLLDSAAKRVDFLSFIRDELGLPNVTVRQMRAEDAGRDAALREGFDVATARGVAELRILAEYCLPLTRVGGLFLGMKGPDCDAELAGAASAIATLGGRLEGVDRFSLPASGGQRSLILVRKEAPTPAQYPRRAGVPERRPL